MGMVKRVISCFLVPVFLLANFTACEPTEVQTAKNVMQQASFYVQLAEQLITVAEANYKSNAKVKKALEATRQSLTVVRSALAAASSGLDKDMAALSKAVVALTIEVFALVEAIQEAKAASAATP